jgi:alpha-ketoglutarate-dependent taurine dioxygenase
MWHTDNSFKRLPARASLLYARSIPPVGGHTEFADERAAYDALPEQMKRRLESLVAEHSILYSRARRRAPDRTPPHAAVRALFADSVGWLSAGADGRGRVGADGGRGG